MMKASEYVLKDNDQFEGFCVDMLQEIAELVGFKYKIELVPDGKYGAPDENGQWNGMVKQVVDRDNESKVSSVAKIEERLEKPRIKLISS